MAPLTLKRISEVLSSLFKSWFLGKNLRLLESREGFMTKVYIDHHVGSHTFTKDFSHWVTCHIPKGSIL